MMHKTLIALLLAATGCAALAQATPVGLWKTIDDDGKIEKSMVRITESGGAVSGRVEKIFDLAKASEVCHDCSDERKNQAVMGMTIIRGAKKGDDGAWVGGDILDPNNGKVYKLRLKPVDGGKKLEVRGYLGLPMLGRTQTWIRVE
ncbi:MAG: DUF2147 domain-containing protein [Betaproteobacteria bacterium]|nr:DUF2147 domain-containing protein [Betaproteobacteria bacterium]